MRWLRLLMVVLLAMLAWLQYHLWLDEGGRRSVAKLEAQVDPSNLPGRVAVQIARSGAAASPACPAAARDPIAAEAAPTMAPGGRAAKV